MSLRWHDMKMRITHFCRTYILPLPCVIFLFFTGCSKEENQNQIPYVAVNFVITPNSTEYLELNPVGGWVYLTGGYKGILVYRKSTTEFMAYERACPYDWDVTGARIDVEASAMTAVCPVCQSKFILIDGSTFEGPTHYPLKQYQTQYDGNLLYITN
jgi:nitrite reductase/ring-hydroxylating ferredoxin subunit